MTDPQNKNNMPIILAIVAVIVIAAGAMFYFSKNMKNDAASPSVDTASTGTGTQASGADADAPETTSPATPAAEPAPSQDEQNEATSAAGGEIDGVSVRPGNPVVARVDGRDVTRVDVFRFIKMMPGNIQQLPPAAVYPLALDQVVNTRLVQNKAEAAGLENDPEVQAQLDLARQQIIRTVYVQREVDKEISDGDLRKAYDEYAKNIPAVEEIHARHILVADEARAKELIAELKNGGDFNKLAAENSGDPGNKDKGGDLGWFTAQDMVPEFSKAAFKIGKGQVADAPIKTQFGWHVVKVEDKRTRAKPTFDELKPMLQVELRRQQLDKKLKAWREAAKIELFDINGDARPAAAAAAAPAGAGASSSEPAAEAPAAAQATDDAPADDAASPDAGSSSSGDASSAADSAE